MSITRRGMQSWWYGMMCTNTAAVSASHRVRAQDGDHLLRQQAFAGERVSLLLCRQRLCREPVPAGTDENPIYELLTQGFEDYNVGHRNIATVCKMSVANSRGVREHGVPPTDRDADGGAAGRTDSVRSCQLYHVCR